MARVRYVKYFRKEIDKKRFVLLYIGNQIGIPDWVAYQGASMNKFMLLIQKVPGGNYFSLSNFKKIFLHKKYFWI